jgi:hypothetical protein
MSEIESALQREKSKITTDGTTDKVFSVAEPISGLLAGFSIKLVFDCFKDKTVIAEMQALAVLFSVVCLVVFCLFIWRRVNRTKPSDTSNLDYLGALYKKDKLECEVDRKNTLGQFIDKSIQSLNANTCIVTGFGEDSQLCQEPLIDGLSKVLDPIIQQPHYLLNCSKSSFTVSLCITAPKKTETGCCLDFEEAMMNFRDDFGVHNLIASSMTATKGIPLSIKSLAEQSYGDSDLLTANISHGGRALKIITSPVPAVCEGDNIGVMYIVCEENVPMPPDVANTLQIFGRLAANWISKYQECMVNDIFFGLLRLKTEGALENNFVISKERIASGAIELPEGVKMTKPIVKMPERRTGYIPPELRTKPREEEPKVEG